MIFFKPIAEFKIASIDPKICDGKCDQECWDVCNQKAAMRFGGGLMEIDHGCNGCGDCLEHCPKKAIKIITKFDKSKK